MSTNFPTSLDSFTNPQSTDTLSSVPHATQHQNHNDAITALETKVGVNGSAVTTTHDYKLSAVTGSNKALSSGTSTQSVTNLSLTTPSITIGSDATGDMYYRNAGGAFTRLGIGTSGQILNVDGTGVPAWVANPSAANASTTVKGVVEEATQAEVDAKTQAGGTGADLFVNPTTLRATKYTDYVADTGSSTAYAIAPSPAYTAYAIGQEFTFKATNANTTTTPTLNVNSLGAKTIVTPDGGSILIGQIPANGMVKVVYDGTNMQLLAPTVVKTAQGQTSRAIASGTGTQNIAHGLGVTPKLIKITSVGYHASGTSLQTICFGTATSTSSKSCTYSASGSGTLPAYGQDSSNIIVTRTNTNGTDWVATLSALDATNITLNFTQAGGTNTVYIQWEAFA